MISREIKDALREEDRQRREAERKGIELPLYSTPDLTNREVQFAVEAYLSGNFSECKHLQLTDLEVARIGRREVAHRAETYCAQRRAREKAVYFVEDVLRGMETELRALIEVEAQ